MNAAKRHCGHRGRRCEKAFEEVLVPAEWATTWRSSLELGRFMLGPNGALVTTAMPRKKHTYKEYIGVDACACQS
ncbi:MAG: hypothetical protein ACLUHE_16230 [Christensenellales bacterium]